ncbi:cupin-like domain-containing protein [Alphaproteobacteria bacterium]|jgi:hypothetical protein|nr:cupin-like domain-containing protein [Alphaproteobacteria bacterium]
MAGRAHLSGIAVQEISADNFNNARRREQLLTASAPFIVRGLIADWPLVQAGLKSGAAARDYLLEHSQDRKFVVSYGPPENQGAVSYNRDMSVNFVEKKAPLSDIFADIDRSENDPEQPLIYMSSIDIDAFFNGFLDMNRIDLGERKCRAGLWLGMRSRVPIHNDFPDNIACVAVGNRRFTLFPPDQFANLYLGPLDYTPAGRSISMVDLSDPDLIKFPKFKQALENSFCVDLAPGDAIHIPSMWWHSVEGLDKFNAMTNFWWRDTPAYLGTPDGALMHAIYSIRDLPEDEKVIWRDLFNHYIFENSEELVSHIPENGRGVLSKISPTLAQKIRTYLLGVLNR